MFDIFYLGKKPNLFVHEQAVDSIEQAQQLSRTRYFWIVNYLCDYTEWDWLWEPVPWESNFVHAWPSQHHDYSGTYLVPKHVDEYQYKFHNKILPNRASDENLKLLVKNSEFDTTWHPHPLDPPYIYVFGNQWWPAEIMPTVEYHVPGAVNKKYVNEPKATLTERHDNHWHTIIDCKWDYSWQPDPGDPPYIYVFGNQWYNAEVMPTVEYHVLGATEKKYMSWPRAELLPDTTCWQVPSGIDQSNIDFSWVPDPGSPPYIYQFGTQHQKTGGPQYRVPGATDVKYIDQIKVKTDRIATALYEIDFLDGNAGQISNTTKIVRYFDNYLDTLKRIAKNVQHEHEFVWICSSICDYTDFDFSWHPEQWQASMLHVFPSDGEKFGDTFFMHAPTFAYRSEQCKLLDWYDLNFVKGTTVTRRPLPVIRHSEDSHVDAVPAAEWAGPLAVFSVNGVVDHVPTVPMWRAETKTIVPLSTGASSVVVPRAAIPYIKEQFYDYPHIDKTKQIQLDQPLDIVFISNGETGAEENWQHLQTITKGVENRVVRSDGVNGRGAAYRAAAESSNTPWFFAVFAKLEVAADFDWSWQPDRLQRAKHYIFNAINPVNGLEYGHQGMIAYNKQLVLSTQDIKGLDFTLSQPHGVEPVNSGIARFNTDAWSTWRTAFREVVKLRHYVEQSADVETAYRLKKWQTQAAGDYAEWCLKGASDAVEYYESVAGNYDQLLLTFEWAWLRDYYNKKYQA